MKGIPNCWYEKDFYLNKKCFDKNKNKTNNRILLDKRPYFFLYLYPDSKKQLKQYIQNKEFYCNVMFRKTLKQILEKDFTLLSEKEQEFVKDYERYYPLIDSNSPMNSLCHYIERLDFNLKEKIKPLATSGEFDFTLYKNRNISYTPKQKQIVLSVVSNYNKSKLNCVKEAQDNVVDQTLYHDLIAVISNEDIIVNVLVDYYYGEKPKSNKSLVWKYFGKTLFENVLQNSSTSIFFPVKTARENSDLVYLGQNYKLEAICFDNQK